MIRLMLLFLLASANVIWCQTSERIHEQLEFRFVTPGARAIGLGKAFVGLADDATAAYSNPAGLSNLLKQEFSLEVISTDIDHHRLVPSENSETRVFGETVYAPSFMSYAAPYNNATFSIFRNVLQKYEETFEFPGRFIPSINRREGSSHGEISSNAENYGLGLSYLLHRSVSIGGSFVVAHMDVHEKFRTGPADDPGHQSLTDDSDISVGAILGVLVRPIPKLSIGAVYHSGFNFDMEIRLNGRYVSRRGITVDLTGTSETIDFVIPTRFSFGAAYRWNDHLTTTTDFVRVLYSQQVTERFLVLSHFDVISRDNFFIRDVWEVHSGAEYRFHIGQTAIGLRGGIFTEPDHDLRFRAFPDTDEFAAAIQNFRFNTLPQETAVGLSVGLGIVIAGNLQFDAAVSFSKESDEIVLSWVVKL